jgi:hypothetical protein
MPLPTPQKIPGKISAPPSQPVFDLLPVKKWCASVRGVFYRLHSIDLKTGKMWPAVSFSQRGTTRFDPSAGVGSLYLGETLSGAMMEVFDDLWGPAGDPSRSLTRTQLHEWFVTLISVPEATLFEARKGNLSRIGTDMQLVTGDHTEARDWALRLMHHPADIDGIRFPSRHDSDRLNLALFKRAHFLPEQPETSLTPPASAYGMAAARASGPLHYGPSVLLAKHPELIPSLQELDVAVLP